MNPLFGIAIISAVIYGLLIDATYFKIYFVLVLAYIACTQYIGTHNKYNNKRKKLNIATWSAPSEGICYVHLEFDCTKAIQYFEKVKKETGVPVTITHLTGMAVGKALQNEPDFNGRIAFGNYYPKYNVDVSFLVALDNGKDLASCTIADADQKSIDQISNEIFEAAKKVRNHKDNDHKARTLLPSFMPSFIISPLAYSFAYVSQMLGISLPAFGLRKNAFGSAVVTSVGMLGYSDVIAPFPPFTHVPLVVTVGGIVNKPRVIGDEIKIRPCVTINLTVDHRYMDGARVNHILSKFGKCMEEPEEYLKQEQENKNVANQTKVE